MVNTDFVGTVEFPRGTNDLSRDLSTILILLTGLRFFKFFIIAEQNSIIHQNRELSIKIYWTRIIVKLWIKVRAILYKITKKLAKSLSSIDLIVDAFSLKIVPNSISVGNDSCSIDSNAKSLSRCAEPNKSLLLKRSDSVHHATA